jgi:hypothetical protein
MLWTWDGYRSDGGDWRCNARNAHYHELLHFHFVARVDRLFYATAVAFAVCVAMLLVR